MLKEIGSSGKCKNIVVARDLVPWARCAVVYYILIAVFLITGILVFISLKWFESLIKAFAMILASRPITFILSIIGIIQAVLLFLQYPEGILSFLLI